MRVLTGIALLTVVALSAMGEIVFYEDWDDQARMEGQPDGWLQYGAGTLSRGINGDSYSSSNAMYTALDFGDAGMVWGTGAYSTDSFTHDILADTAYITAWMRATNGFTDARFAFMVMDADGTEWVTDTADRFILTSTYSMYSNTVADMIVNAAGTTPGLDYQNITRYGWYIFNNSGTDDTHIDMIQVDDFTVTSIPEPSTIAFVGLGLLALIARRRLVVRSR